MVSPSPRCLSTDPSLQFSPRPHSVQTEQKHVPSRPGGPAPNFSPARTRSSCEARPLKPRSFSLKAAHAALDGAEYRKWRGGAGYCGKKGERLRCGTTLRLFIREDQRYKSYKRYKPCLSFGSALIATEQVVRRKGEFGRRAVPCFMKAQCGSRPEEQQESEAFAVRKTLVYLYRFRS
jgi:hypothetical protein